MKLNLGCGIDKRNGYINIDISPNVNPDLVLDLSASPLPYEDNSVDEIVAIDFVEHILYPIPVFNECWRVLKSDGVMHIETPLGGSVDFYKDPTHVRPFVPETFQYFTYELQPAYGIKRWTINWMRTTQGGENENRIFLDMQPIK